MPSAPTPGGAQPTPEELRRLSAALPAGLGPLLMRELLFRAFSGLSVDRPGRKPDLAGVSLTDGLDRWLDLLLGALWQMDLSWVTGGTKAVEERAALSPLDRDPLADLAGLRCLDLSSNYIGVHGASAMASFLSGPLRGGTLRCLSLFRCNLGNDGMCHIARSLQANTSLLWLDLGANYNESAYIDSASVLLLGQSVQSNPRLNLRVLGLAMNGIPWMGVYTINGLLLEHERGRSGWRCPGAWVPFADPISAPADPSKPGQGWGSLVMVDMSNNMDGVTHWPLDIEGMPMSSRMCIDEAGLLALQGRLPII